MFKLLVRICDRPLLTSVWWAATTRYTTRPPSTTWPMPR